MICLRVKNAARGAVPSACTTMRSSRFGSHECCEGDGRKKVRHAHWRVWRARALSGRVSDAAHAHIQARRALIKGGAIVDAQQRSLQPECVASDDLHDCCDVAARDRVGLGKPSLYVCSVRRERRGGARGAELCRPLTAAFFPEQRVDDQPLRLIHSGPQSVGSAASASQVAARSVS